MSDPVPARQAPTAVEPQPEVLVVGAGPVGMTAAAELARHGVRVRIVDKRAGPVEHSQALGVQVRTQEVLRAMGIVDEFLAAGFPLERVSVRAFGRRLGVMHPGGIDSPHPVPLAVGQQITERLLVEHLLRLGVTVERQVEAVDFDPDESGVGVTLWHQADGKREEIIRVPWLVDCEGSGSKARDVARIPFEGARYTGEEFVMADVHVEWSFPHGSLYAFIEKDSTLACFPFDAHGHYRVLCVRDEADPDNRESPTLAEMQDITRTLTGDPGLRLSEPQWLCRFRTQHRIASRFRAGRIFLAGDAAHVHVPIGGQGMNYGMQDAFNLAWKLAAVIRGHARPEPLLDSYDQERHTVAAALLEGTDASFRTMVHPNALTEFTMKFIAPIALGWEAVQGRMRTSLAEVNVAYASSPLVEDRRGGHGLAAGHRAADALVVRLPEQETIHLMDLFSQPDGWTLLLLAGENSPEPADTLVRIAAAVAKDHSLSVRTYLVLLAPEAVQPSKRNQPTVLLDREHSVHEKYGALAPCMYLVRPDGYVGFRGGLEHVGDLITYLCRIGLVTDAERPRG